MSFDALDLPELEQPSESFSFETYKNYLRSLSLYTVEHYGAKPDCFLQLKSVCARQGVFTGVQPRLLNCNDFDEVRKLLFNAWNTELVLFLPACMGVDFIKYANHWSSVQAYYAVYLALQAYFRSIGLQPPPKDHSASLNTVCAQICRQNLFPPFWNVCCDGEPTPKGAKYLRIPPDVLVKEINPLTTPALQDFWHWYGMLLRTTRKRQFEKKLDEGRKQFRTKKGRARKRLTAEHKARLLADLRPTTVFDFLYRLRIRSNYEDADAFILGTMSQTDAQEFNEALCLLAETTLFLIELHVAARVGAQEVARIIDDFVKADKKGYSQNTVGARRPFLV